MGTRAYVCGYACVCRYVLVEPEDNSQMSFVRCCPPFFLRLKNHVKYVCVFHCVCVYSMCLQQADDGV